MYAATPFISPTPRKRAPSANHQVPIASAQTQTALPFRDHLKGTLHRGEASPRRSGCNVARRRANRLARLPVVYAPVVALVVALVLAGCSTINAPDPTTSIEEGASRRGQRGPISKFGEISGLSAKRPRGRICETDLRCLSGFACQIALKGSHMLENHRCLLLLSA